MKILKQSNISLDNYKEIEDEDCLIEEQMTDVGQLNDNIQNSLMKNTMWRQSHWKRVYRKKIERYLVAGSFFKLYLSREHNTEYLILFPVFLKLKLAV